MMMHFSIPSTQDLYADRSGTTYTGYNIFINGSYHCCVRYKQLHALHETLKRHCANANIWLPPFPPKRFLPLTYAQIETRRLALEQYLQIIGQNTLVSKSDFIQKFFFTAQQDSAATNGTMIIFEDTSKGLGVEVVLSSGYNLNVQSCLVTDNTSSFLQKVCAHIQLPLHFASYFCLYLAKKGPKNSLILIRRLMDFESPFLSSIQSMPCQILLRTGYWNNTYDSILLKDSVALNILYTQTVSDIEREWIIAPLEVRQKLRTLQDHCLKKDFMELVRILPQYNCIQFTSVFIDYPEPQTSALISIGNKELSMRILKGTKILETKFRITRMRCWRVTTVQNINSDLKDISPHLQFSFEYLMSKQTMRWITIKGSQTMLMSVCLQSMVDELLKSKNNKYVHVHNSTEDERRHSNELKLNDSDVSTLTPSPCFDYINESTNLSSETPSSNIKFISQSRSINRHQVYINSFNVYSSVLFRNDNEPIQNQAFEEIGDDDL